MMGPAPEPGRTPILLCNANYYGTLAAVRSLGRAGVPVVTADPSKLSPAHYSRYTSQHLRCVPFQQTDAFVDWLMRAGESGPRRALYATSDDVSFAFSVHRERLATAYSLYQPDLDTMMRMLDKGQMRDHALAVGFELPQTWLPASRAAVEKLSRELADPLILKPRTQVGSKVKGAVVDARRGALLVEYDRFVAQANFGSVIRERYPEAMQPLVQRYHPEAVDKIYSLTGFRDASGRMSPLLGANKLLQHPRHVGVGLCFESAPADPDLAKPTRQLLERIGYYGVFELEFIRSGGRTLLIDVNARLYNQLALDVARGLDLPGLAYAGAIGDEEQLTRLLEGVPAEADGSVLAFCNGFGLGVTVNVQRALGTMSREEADRWQQWRTRRDRPIVGAVADRDDPIPFACDVTQQILGYARHPRAFLRQYGLTKW